MDDFDFLYGTWDVANRKLSRPLSGGGEWEEFPGRATVRPLLGGLGNIDEIAFPTRGWMGATMRLYDVERKEWSIHWASSRTGRLDPPVVGRFEGDRGVFQGTDTYEGRPIRVRFTWHRQGPESACWEQEFSADDGDTWELNWVMDLRRADEAGAEA